MLRLQPNKFRQGRICKGTSRTLKKSFDLGIHHLIALHQPFTISSSSSEELLTPNGTGPPRLGTLYYPNSSFEKLNGISEHFASRILKGKECQRQGFFYPSLSWSIELSNKKGSIIPLSFFP
jgi:hypothetical protein